VQDGDKNFLYITFSGFFFFTKLAIHYKDSIQIDFVSMWLWKNDKSFLE